jgi:hypothetical protein
MLLQLTGWLAGAALAASTADCIDWVDCPVAAHLHPVGQDFGFEYQTALETTMSGENSSPLFTGALNEAEAHWRLLAATGAGRDFGDQKATEWRDLALVGSFLAFNRVVDDTFARAPALDAVRRMLDTAISPSVDLAFRRDGRVRAKHVTGWELGQRFEQREEDAGFDPDQFEEHGKRRPPLRLHLGMGWKLRDPEAPETDPLLTWNAHVSLRSGFGLLLRGDWAFFEEHWEVLARQTLFDGVSAEGNLRSEDEGPLPNRWAAGLLYNPEPRWMIRLQRGQLIEDDAWDIMGSVRVELGSRLPGRLHPSLAGLPVVPDRSPNQLRPAWTWAGEDR